MTTTLPSRISHGFAALRRGDPIRALQEEVDDLLNRFSNDFDAEWMMRPFAPAADVSESDSAVQVRFDIPGTNPQEIDVRVSNGMLHVTGERKEEREEQGKTWHRIERRTGSFSRTVGLPCAVQDDQARAGLQGRRLDDHSPENGRVAASQDQGRRPSQVSRRSRRSRTARRAGPAHQSPVPAQTGRPSGPYHVWKSNP